VTPGKKTNADIKDDIKEVRVKPNNKNATVYLKKLLGI